MIVGLSTLALDNTGDAWSGLGRSGNFSGFSGFFEFFFFEARGEFPVFHGL
jgi:hypothetical protein